MPLAWARAGLPRLPRRLSADLSPGAMNLARVRIPRQVNSSYYFTVFLLPSPMRASDPPATGSFPHPPSLRDPSGRPRVDRGGPRPWTGMVYSIWLGPRPAGWSATGPAGAARWNAGANPGPRRPVPGERTPAEVLAGGGSRDVEGPSEAHAGFPVAGRPGDGAGTNISASLCYIIPMAPRSGHGFRAGTIAFCTSLWAPGSVETGPAFREPEG